MQCHGCMYYHKGTTEYGQVQSDECARIIEDSPEIMEPVTRTATYNGWTYSFLINHCSITVYDDNGDWLTVIPVKDGNKLEDDDLSALIHMYIKGLEVGRRDGTAKAQRVVREALGINW